MLVGDVLPLKNQIVWRNLVQLAKRKAGDNVVIAAAHSRPELYGKFTLRAFQRYGESAELLPLAEEFQQFSTDYRYLATDQNTMQHIRSAGTVFFVGGAPQRLSKVIFATQGAPLATAVQDSYASGSLIVGGIPSRVVISTETHALDVLKRGNVLSDDMFKGLGLLKQDWYVDQNFFGSGRFAISLVAMHQLGMDQGIGVGLDTAAVIHQNTIEVLGNRGVVIIDISEAKFDVGRKGVEIKRARLSYLENGDRFQMDTMEATPYAKKLNDFQLSPHTDASASDTRDYFVSSQEIFRSGEFLRLMYEALESESGESIGYALYHKSKKGFSFRFYTGPDSFGWLTTSDGEDRFSLINIYLDIEPLG